MKDQKALHVIMLGGFEMRYGTETVHLKKRQSAKPVQLLQLLLHNREMGLSRRGVIEALYGPETEIDTSNNLNATVSQLRRLLKDTILPKENYISTHTDRYCFRSSFPVWVDTEEVLKLRQAASETVGTERMDLLYQLCALYRGRFLPGLDGESWVEIARGYYQKIYRESMEALCRMLWEAKEYQTILRLTEYAAKLFPFEEWQAWQYESLLAMGRIRDAQELYREVEKLYLSELDAPLPERMRQRLRTPVQERQMEVRNVCTIRDQLDEASKAGPYCLSLPSFLDAYHLISRISGAAGQPVCLMLCTLRGGNNSSQPDREQFCAAMEQLETVLCQTLRQEDTFTRYSRSQYLAVLIGVEESDFSTISQRIVDQFRSTGVSPRFAMECQGVSSEYIHVSGGMQP